MQYIKKNDTPPTEWENWFKTGLGKRSFDYGNDYSSLRNLGSAKKFLIEEQHGLCAYCQQQITLDNSSIEHVIAKEHNKELSTNYYNLVVVCKTPPKDIHTGKLHCDKERGSKLIPPLIFVSNSDVNHSKNNAYFDAYADGTIVAKPNLEDVHKKQAEVFIDVLNLNHQNLKDKRAKDVLGGLITAYSSISKYQKDKNSFWQIQFDRILKNQKYPFRQFLLIYIAKRLGK